MSHNPYIYILIMAAVTFAIRVLPLTLVKKAVYKHICAFVSLLCAVCNAFGNDISGNNQRNSQSDCRHSSLCGRSCSGMVQRRSFQGFMRMLCSCVHS